MSSKYAIRISSMEAITTIFDDRVNILINKLLPKGKLIGCFEHPDNSHYHVHLFYETDHYKGVQGIRDVVQKIFVETSYKADKERGFKPIMISDKSKTPWTLATAAFYMSKGPKAKALPGQEKRKGLKVYDISTKLNFSQTRLLYLNSGIIEEFAREKFEEFWEHSRLRQNQKVIGDSTHFERLYEICSYTFQSVGADGLMHPREPNVKQMISVVSEYFANMSKTRFGASLIADYVNLMMYHFGSPMFKIDFENGVYEKFFSHVRV